MPVQTTLDAAIKVSVSTGIGPPIVVTGSGTSVVGVAGVSPFVAGDNISISAVNGSLVFAAEDLVLSVQGRTGAVSLSLADLTAAAEVHTHSTSEVTGLAEALSEIASPVVSVQGRTGEVVLTLSDITGAEAVHTHSTSDVSGLTATIQALAPVASVQGRTGEVVLTLADITAAEAVHTHSTSQISGLTATIQALAPVAPVASVQGRTGEVVLTLADITAANAVHTHSTSDISGLPSLNGITGPAAINAGVNVSVSVDGTAITIASSPNTNAVLAAWWPSLIFGG